MNGGVAYNLMAKIGPALYYLISKSTQLYMRDEIKAQQRENNRNQFHNDPLSDFITCRQTVAFNDHDKRRS